MLFRVPPSKCRQLRNAIAAYQCLDRCSRRRAVLYLEDLGQFEHSEMTVLLSVHLPRPVWQ